MKRVIFIIMTILLLVLAGCSTKQEYIRITFNTVGGRPVDDIVMVKGSKAIGLPVPTKVGHTFAGWYLDNQYKVRFDESKVGTESVNLFAKWTINTYTLSFNSNGGSEVAPIVALFDSFIVEPAPPVKYGANFGGWFIDVNFIFEFTYWRMPSSSVTLHAKWIPNTHDI